LEPVAKSPFKWDDQGMTKSLVIIAILFAAQSFADTPPAADAPRSAAAVDAQQAHDATIKRAKAAYDQAVLMADRKLVDDLDAALHNAMANGNADEVVRITSAKKSAEVGLAKVSTDRSSDNSVAPPGGGRVDLMMALAGTRWSNAYADIVLLNPDVTGQRKGEKGLRWGPISQNQIVVLWASGSTDLWTFNVDRSQLTKQFIGRKPNDLTIAHGSRF
jgi:hypothetical protein